MQEKKHKAVLFATAVLIGISIAPLANAASWWCLRYEEDAPKIFSKVREAIEARTEQYACGEASSTYGELPLNRRTVSSTLEKVNITSIKDRVSRWFDRAKSLGHLAASILKTLEK